MQGILCTEGLTVLNASLLRILFIVNTVKTISAVRDHKERKESVLLLLWSFCPETGALTVIMPHCESSRRRFTM